MKDLSSSHAFFYRWSLSRIKRKHCIKIIIQKQKTLYRNKENKSTCTTARSYFNLDNVKTHCIYSYFVYGVSDMLNMQPFYVLFFLFVLFYRQCLKCVSKCILLYEKVYFQMDIGSFRTQTEHES